MNISSRDRLGYDGVYFCGRIPTFHLHFPSPWRWRQHGPLKRWYQPQHFTKLQHI